MTTDLLIDDAAQIQFIKDEASDEDFFGTHERIATSVAAVIRSHDDLKVLGLVGPWGSGKSTVIKLTEKCLKNDKSKETKFFIYDAWLHQSDPPRRSFLERLVDFAGLSDNEDWKERLAELNGQIDDLETTTTPTFTKSGRWILLSLFLLPIGFEFVGRDWFSVWIPLPWVSFKWSVFWTGMAILFLPALVAGWIYLAWRPVKCPFATNWAFFRRVNWTTHKKPNQRRSIISLFMNKAVTRENHRTTKSPDPTTIEFQKNFRDLVQAISNDKHRYVFVIDNLDRLPETTAIELWTTIRSFFLGTQKSSGVTLPTILLPIDPDAIRRMYEATNEKDAARLAQAFMDKTFHLTFRVPPQVFSDWRNYVDRQMQYAFQNKCPSIWIYQLGALYEKFVTSTERGIVTPRHINTLINSICTLRLQWKDEIPFAAIAYFSIYRDDIHKNIGKFISSSKADIARFDEKWPTHIAALHYGVPVHRALQVQMEVPLTKAIQEFDNALFKEQLATPGFDSVFETVISNAAKEPEFTANAAALLEANELPGKDWVQAAWDELMQRLENSLNWKSLQPQHREGLKAIVLHCSSDRLERNLTAIASTISNFDAEPMNAPLFSSNWATMLETVENACIQRGQSLSEVEFTGDARGYLSVVETLGAKSKLLPRITRSADDNAIMLELGAQLSVKQLSETVPTKLNALLESKLVEEFQPLMEAANQRIRSANLDQPGVEEAMYCLGRLWTTDAKVAPYLQPLSNEGFLAERFYQAHTTKRIAAEASVLALVILLNPTFANPGGHDRANQGTTLLNTLEAALNDRQEIVPLVSVCLSNYSTKSVLSTLSKAALSNAHLKPLANGIFNLRVNDGKLGTLPVEDVINNLGNYLQFVDSQQHGRFIELLPGYSSFWEELESTPLSDAACAIYKSLIGSSDAEIRQQAETMLRRKLGEVDVSTWTNAITSGNEPYEIASVLAKQSDRPIELGQQLFDALSSMTPSMLVGDDKDVIENWFQASNYLKANSKQTLLKSLRDQLLRPELPVGRKLILDVGNVALLDDGHFDDKADDAVRYLVAPMLAADSDADWLSAMSTRIVKWIGKAEDETRGFITERVAEIWQNGDDKTKARMKLIGTNWNLAEMPWNINKSPSDGSLDASQS